MIESIHLKNFTVFENVKIDFCRGINLIMGQNGTGKTHLLKAIYSMISAACQKKSVAYKLSGVFLPENGSIKRLIRRTTPDAEAIIALNYNGNVFKYVFSVSAGEINRIFPSDCLKGDVVLIPASEILADAIGYKTINFEENFRDLINQASGVASNLADYSEIAERIESILGGTAVEAGGSFFLKTKKGKIEFSLLAEGLRKFGLLDLLLKNGVLKAGAVLLWDLPENCVNPSLIRSLVEIVLSLQRLGVQNFITTHSYVVFREFDLQAKKEDRIRYFTLTREEKTEAVTCTSNDDYIEATPGFILDAYNDIYTREVQRSIGGIS